MSSPTVVVAGVADTVARRLCDPATGFDVVVADSAASVVSQVQAGRAAVVVLGAGDDALGEVRRVRQVDSLVPIIVVAPPEAHAQLDAAIRVDPLVGRSTRCVRSDRAVELAALVADHADRELRRRSHATLLRQIAEVQLPAALARPVTASQYLGQLLEHATIGVVTVDLDGTIRGWNPKAEAITGRRQRDAVGKRIFSLFRSTEGRALRLALGRAAASTEAVTEVLTRRGPDGTDQHLELTAASIDDGEGRLGNLVLVHDVTDKVRTERELDVRARNAALTADVAVALTSGVPLSAQLARCAEAVVAQLDAALARIWTLDRTGEVLVLRASAGMYTHLDGAHSRVAVGELKIGKIAATRQPHLTNDLRADRDISDPAWAASEAIVAFAGYPLVIGDQIVGVLALFARHLLPEVTLASLASIADTIAVGIEQAANAARVGALLERERDARQETQRALERHVSLVRTLQQSLLPPKLPAVAHLEVAARYHWAGAGDVVGGDFYDMFRLADGRHCIVIGDVSGKGVDAASLTALARHTLRAAARTEHEPIAVLATLNQILVESAGGDRFCTVALVTVEDKGSDGWRVSLTNAGHLLPLHLPADGSIREVGRTGLPLGLFSELDVSECPVAVESGDLLVLFTDGVTEAREPGGEFRPDLVYDVVGRMRTAPAAQVAAELESAVVGLQAGRPRDDVAIVAVRFSDQAPA